MVFPYISRRILRYTFTHSPSLWISFLISFTWNEFSKIQFFSEPPRKKLWRGKSKYYSFCLNWGTLCESFFALMCLSYVGTIEKKVRLDFFLYWSSRVSKEDGEGRERFERHKKLSEWARGITIPSRVPKNYKIIRERQKKTHISRWSHDNHDES